MSRSIVLAYHSVSPGWPSNLAVPLSTSKDSSSISSRWLARRHLLADRAGEAPDDAVAITFDDGYRAVHEHAFPIMRELGLVARSSSRPTTSAASAR